MLASILLPFKWRVKRRLTLTGKDDRSLDLFNKLIKFNSFMVNLIQVWGFKPKGSHQTVSNWNNQYHQDDILSNSVLQENGICFEIGIIVDFVPELNGLQMWFSCRWFAKFNKVFVLLFFQKPSHRNGNRINFNSICLFFNCIPANQKVNCIWCSTIGLFSGKTAGHDFWLCARFPSSCRLCSMVFWWFVCLLIPILKTKLPTKRREK